MRSMQHEEDRPLRARVGDHRHIAPRQRDAVAAIHRAEISGRVGVEIMPVPIRRHRRHAPHDDGRRQFELGGRLDPIVFAHQKPARRLLRAQQCLGKEAALEVAPCKQHIVRVHTAEAVCARLERSAESPAGCMNRLQAVAAMEHLVRDMCRQFELQARRIVPQTLVHVYR